MDNLLSGPECGWRIGHIEMNHLPSIVQKNKKYLEHTKCYRWNGEEINRDNFLGVVLQECSPGLRWRLFVTYHVFRDSRLTDFNAKFQQFTVDPWCAP